MLKTAGIWEQKRSEIELTAQLQGKVREVELQLNLNKEAETLRSHIAGSVVEILKQKGDYDQTGDTVEIGRAHV